MLRSPLPHGAASCSAIALASAVARVGVVPGRLLHRGPRDRIRRRGRATFPGEIGPSMSVWPGPRPETSPRVSVLSTSQLRRNIRAGEDWSKFGVIHNRNSHLPGHMCGGAGGNRTPVHQPVDEPATTVPDIEAVAAPPAGRLATSPRGEVARARSFPGVSRLSGRQWSFPPPSPASVAGLRETGPVWHCCSRCASRHLRFRRRRRIALVWQFLLVPCFTSLSNSGRMPAQRY